MTRLFSEISQVLIVVESNAKEITEPVTLQMVSALQQAIATSTDKFIKVEVITVLELKDRVPELIKDIFICPLTLNLPSNLSFNAQLIYQACQDIPSLRQRVVQLGYAIAEGHFWLPLVLTAKGLLYGEVIELSEAAAGEILLASNLSYYQPFHLSDAKRQQIYQMGYSLLQLLSAPPATYLMQFGLQGDNIYFDRLLPFPAAPAIASLGVQEPDLFACHWYCLTNMPILDLNIIPSLALPS